MAALGEKELRDVLFVRAFEQGAAEGEILSLREREITTRETRAQLKRPHQEREPLEVLWHRAERLRKRIERSYPAAARVLEGSGRRGIPLWLVFVASLLCGLALDRL